jgi:hypothetical protein
MFQPCRAICKTCNGQDFRPGNLAENLSDPASSFLDTLIQERSTESKPSRQIIRMKEIPDAESAG